MWTGKDYKGTKYKVTEPGNIVNLPAKVNNKVTSAKNRWVNRAFLYEGKGGNGQPFCINDGDKVPDFSDYVDSSNNKVSSVFLDEGGGACPPRRPIPKASKSSCPDGRMCVWTKPGYEGKRLVLGKHRGVSNRIYDYQGDPDAPDPAGPFNDNVSSVKVRKSGIGVLYANVNGDGESRCFTSEHRRVPDLAAPAWNFDNSASSSAIPKHDAPCLVRRSSAQSKAGSGCPADTLCVWSRKNYRGQKVEITKINAISNKLAKRMDNEASSFKNRIALPGVLYAKKDGEGAIMGFCDNEKLPDLGDPKVDFDNRASSSLVGSLPKRRARRIC